MGIEEAADQIVCLAGAAMPGAEAEAFEDMRAIHGSSECRNAGGRWWRLSTKVGAVIEAM
jgi:hypothetical protein